MKSKLLTIITAGLIAMVGVVGLSAASAPSAYATCADTPNSPACAAQRGADATGTQNKKCGKDGNDVCGIGDVIKQVINVLLFIIGSLSVIMIIFGGIKYVISNGDSSQITSAKNTIMYAVIGLIVALLAYAIVNFVVTQFT